MNPPPSILYLRQTPNLFQNHLQSPNMRQNNPPAPFSLPSTIMARRVLDYACTLAKPGILTDEIDTLVHEAIIDQGAYPSPLNYAGFPKSLCSSINEVICHGIPDSRSLQNGDIVSFDVSCYTNGVHGDNCATVVVGDEQEVDEIGVDWRGVPYKAKFETDEEEAMFRSARRLVHATRESLYAAIDRCGPGGCLTEVGAAIQDVADEYGYSTVTKYRGHGIGEEFHCAPFVKVCRFYKAFSHLKIWHSLRHSLT